MINAFRQSRMQCLGLRLVGKGRAISSTQLLVVVASLLTVPALTAAAQGTPPPATITIRGRVVSSDGSPIAFAEVISGDGVTRARVNERGVFVLRVPAHSEIRARALGFSSKVFTADSSVTVTLTPLPTMLTGLTTTVGAREIRSSESSRSVTIVGREQLRASASVSVNQALRQIPGLQEISAPPARTSISIRGLDDSRVLVLVDGEPVAGSLMDSRDIGRLSTLAAERIEVTKGPSSVEFGSDALGGVINLVQAAPTRELTSDVQLRQGGLGRREGDIGVSQTVGIVGYRLSGGWRQSDRLPGVDATGTSFERVYDWRGDIRVEPTEKLSLRFNGTGTQERQRWPVDRSFNGFIDNSGAQGFAELQYSDLLGGSVRARAFLQQFRYQYRQSRGLLPIAGSGDSLEQREEQQRYLIAWTRAFGAHTVDAGVQHSSRFVLSPDKMENDSVRDKVSEAFARDSWTIGDMLLTAGVRHSTSSLWGASTNPSAGVAWQYSPRLRVRANVARGFRSPGFKDIRYTFTNPSAGYALEGNPDLIPETSVSTSLGGTLAVSSGVSLDIEGYRNDVRNMIETRYSGRNNYAGLLLYTAVNIGKARTSGVETQLRARLGETDIVAGYNWLHTLDVESDLPLSRRAPHSMRLQASREWNIRYGLYTDASVSHTSSAPLVGSIGDDETLAIRDRQGAFTSVDMQLRFALTRITEISFGGVNLLDSRPALWSPAFQRQWYAGVRLHYSAD